MHLPKHSFKLCCRKGVRHQAGGDLMPLIFGLIALDISKALARFTGGGSKPPNWTDRRGIAGESFATAATQREVALIHIKGC